MPDADEDEIQVDEVVEDLSRLLGELGPDRRPGMGGDLDLRSAEFQGRFRRIRSAITLLAERTWPDPPRPAHWRLAELRDVLIRHAPAEGLDPAASHRAWSEFRTHCEPACQALVASLSTGAHPGLFPGPPIRPPNHVRNVYHVLNALAVVVLVEVVLSTWTQRVIVASLGFLTAWGMELTRRLDPRINALLMRLFSPVAHPHEAEQINSATWYTTAILILAWLFPLDAGVVGVVVLGVADPAAALVGRRFGRIQIGARRTLEGTLAFLAVGFVGAWIALQLFAPQGPTIALAAAGAIGGAVGEILSRRIDDNLLIPLLSASAAAAVQWLGGVG